MTPPFLLSLLGCPETTLSKVNESPAVSFVSPADGSTFDEDEPLTFVAAVTDDHQALDELVYAWTFEDGSALIGELEVLDGQVRYTVADGLPDGDYLVTLAVSDSGYRSASDAVSFSVVDNTPPTAEFLEPLDGATFSDLDSIDVDVLVGDAEEDDLNAIALSWSGDLVAGAPSTPTSDGHARFSIAPQAAGSWSIAVTASDSLGSTAYAAVEVVVLAADADGDGVVSTAFGGDDCDDADAGVHPGAVEHCDGVDEDCDDVADDEAEDAQTWYGDADGDGYGDASADVAACEAPEGTVADAGDCDDAASAHHPGATEVCDGDDDDCDGVTDEDDAADAPTWYEDLDGDGWGTTASAVACAAPAGTAATDGDCDDGDAEISPDGAETCDGVDQDCDGETDESASDATTWYRDADGDGAGDPEAALAACALPDGYVEGDEDCDDADAAIQPDAEERCNGWDDDCDGLVDDEDSGVADPLPWYADADGDGYGDAASPSTACLAPADHVADASDCDDAAAGVNPGAEESCTSTDDDDCDGDANELDAAGCTPFYADADGDGSGAGEGSCLCEATEALPVADGEDCDDEDADISPGAAERCEDGQDQDCDGFDAACPLEDSVSATDYDQKIVGNSKSLLLGQEACFVGDGDGDGADEIAVATVYASSSAGAVWVLPGEGSGSVSVSLAETWITGAATSDNFGFAMASGDLDGDGIGDLLVGSYLSDEGGGESGGAWAFLGPITGGVWTASSYEDLGWYGSAASDYFGSSVTTIPDADGDDSDEVAIGAIYEDDGGSNAGSVYLQFGPLSSTSTHRSAALMDVVINGEDSNDYLGASIAADLDFDGDGLEDLLLSAHGDDTIASNAGAIYVAGGVVSLPSSLDASSLDWKFGGDVANDGWGYSTTGHPLSSIGDFDADGYDDFVVGAYTADDVATNAGAVYVVSGRSGSGTYALATVGSKLYGESAGDEFGWTVSGGDDVDGDGHDDFVVGGHYDDDGGSNAGAAWLYYGSSSGDLSTWGAKIGGESASDEAGIRVRMGGDANGDGYADLLLGAWYDDDGATDAGAVYLFSGAPR